MLSNDFDFSSLTEGGGLSLSGVGETIGSNLGIPFGGLIGKGVGSLASGLLGKPTAYAAGAFAGKHSLYVENLDDARVKAPDAETYLRFAKHHQLSVEEIAMLWAAECDRTGQTPQTVWDGYAVTPNLALDDTFAYFNRTNSATIRPGALGPLGVRGPVKVLANYDGKAQLVYLNPASSGGSRVEQPTPAPTSEQQSYGGGAYEQLVPKATSLQMPFTGQTFTQVTPRPTSQNFSSEDLSKLGKAAWNGAIDAASKAFAETPEGKAAQNAGAKQWLNDNGLLIGGVVGVIGMGFTYLLATRKK